MTNKAKMLTEQARALPPQERIALVEVVSLHVDGTVGAFGKCFANADM